jgi:hypothetical protein
MTSKQQEQPDIRQLSEAVEATRIALQDAESEEQEARRRRTDALNRHNEACRAFDAAVEELRKLSPRETDWHRMVHPPRNYQVSES